MRETDVLKLIADLEARLSRLEGLQHTHAPVTPSPFNLKMCSKCGINMDRAIVSYTCPHSGCPVGLGR